MADLKKKLGALGTLGKRLLANPDEARLNELLSHSGDKALPLKLPRANLSDEFINAQADRVARQMLGEHVTSGKAGDTKNLAGRSMKESQRVKNLNYKLTPTGTVAKETPYTPRKGDVKVAFPGDQTVSDKMFDEIEGFPIDSQQQGGAYYGLGQKHLKYPEFWKSTENPAKMVQGKVDRVAELYEPERVIGSHLAMGSTANNFAMHFADANLRAIDWSKAQPSKINQFDRLIAKGYFDPVAKKKVTFPDWPGLADREAALAAMKENTALRKWFNNRMKTPAVTEPLGLPNGLDIQYAITEPRIRDMEINMTGLMTGELKPNALVEAAGAPHNTYSHRILGEAGGPQEVLTPFVLDFPDAAQHIASTKRPSDFTGTIQKVFPHQVVDDQYINQYNQYRQRIKELTGQKKGGAIDINEADKRLAKAIENRMAKGGAVDLEAADARLSAAIEARMGMADGGKVVKGAAKVFKRIFADDVLPAAEREVNLKKFIAPSAEKRKMYHGSKEPNIKEFKTRKEMTDESMMTGHYADERDAVFLSPEPDFTKNFSQMGYTDTNQAPTTYPVYVQVEKPFDFDNPEHLKQVKETYKDMFHNPDSDFYEQHISPSERSMTLHTFNKRVDSLPSDENNWARIENQDFQDVLKDLGFDSFYTRERGTKNLGVYEPNRIKSAIGNRGTYDLGDPDINKAQGGLAMADGGKLIKGLGKIGKRLMADPEAVTPAVGGGTRKFGNDSSGLNIIKETGGNWSPSGDLVYRSQLDRELDKLKKGRFDTPINVIKHNLEQDALAGNTARKAQLEQALVEAQKRDAANNWVDSNLKNYVTKQMATQDDPVRKLAEEGVTAFPKNIDEFDEPQLRTYGSAQARLNRKNTGNVQAGVAKSPLAKHYETITDESINPIPAKNYQRVQALPPMQRQPGTADAPWVNKLDPETPIFSLNKDADFNKLGFDHIMDVLREDVATGRIRPEQMNKISMEQAVRRTHEYDEALKAKMLNARIAEQANANVFKEYPEGYKWVQLDKPGQFNLESDIMGHSVRGYEPPKGHPDYTDISGDSGYDTYGHGGYEAIKSGDAKIYSLRDPKGMSHATIEVAQHKNPYGANGSGFADLPSKTRAEYENVIRQWRRNNPEVEYLTDADINKALKEAGVQPINPPEITQIKGKQNAAPNEAYQPYVQDFVKSGDWADVGDISNTGLMDVKYMTNPETYKKYLEQGLSVPKYATEKELDELHNEYLRLAEPRNYKPPAEGMAEGGGAFKKISFYGGGGLTTSGGTFTPEELGVSADEIGLSKEQWETAKKNAPIVVRNAGKMAKEELLDEYNQLKSLGGVKDFALRTGAQYLGGIPDLVNLGLMLPDALVGTKLASEKPWFGSEQYIDAMHKAGMLGEHEFPLAEIAAGILAPAGLIKKGIKKLRKPSVKEEPKKRQGGLTAMAR